MVKSIYMYMECSAPNLSLMPEVDMITFVSPVINKEPSLLDPTPEHVTMNDM